MARALFAWLMLAVLSPAWVSADDEDLTMEQEREQIGRNMEAERKGVQPALNNSGVPSPSVKPSTPPDNRPIIRRNPDRKPTTYPGAGDPKRPQPGQTP